MKANDCGLKEMPKMVVTVKEEPFKLELRGVVGFYDVLLRIITHYDRIAADKKAFDGELVRRWKQMLKNKRLTGRSNIKVYDNGLDTEHYALLMPHDKKKRETEIRNFFKTMNICVPLKDKTDKVYTFLENSG